MAMQKDLPETPIGVGFQNSYFKITMVQLRRWEPPGVNTNAISAHCVINVDAYVYKPTNKNQMTISGGSFIAPWDEIKAQKGDDFLAQCYNWLHAQPEFADATAV